MLILVEQVRVYFRFVALKTAIITTPTFAPSSSPAPSPIQNIFPSTVIFAKPIENYTYCSI